MSALGSGELLYVAIRLGPPTVERGANRECLKPSAGFRALRQAEGPPQTYTQV